MRCYMEFVASASARISVLPPNTTTTISTTPTTLFISNFPPSTNPLLSSSTNYNPANNHHKCCIKRRNNNNNNNKYRLAPRIHPVTDLISAAPVTLDDAAAAAAAPVVEITWQIIVGAIAGVTPFIVAGIEFGKRIVAQRRCATCGGSGLVLREKDYFRCPTCGGFLPWQSWKRFFTG